MLRNVSFGALCPTSSSGYLLHVQVTRLSNRVRADGLFRISPARQSINYKHGRSCEALSSHCLRAGGSPVHQRVALICEKRARLSRLLTRSVPSDTTCSSSLASPRFLGNTAPQPYVTSSILLSSCLCLGGGTADGVASTTAPAGCSCTLDTASVHTHGYLCRCMFLSRGVSRPSRLTYGDRMIPTQSA